MVDSVKMFLSSGVIIMQNMVTVCRIVWDAGALPLKIRGVSDPLETHAPPNVIMPYLVALR